MTVGVFNAAHIHVLLAHFIPALTIGLVVLLLFAKGFPKEPGLRALVLVVSVVSLIGAITITQYGEGAVRLVVPRGDHALHELVEAHHEWAENAWWYVLASTLLVIWWFIAELRDMRGRVLAWWASFVMSLVVAVIIAIASFQGGKIQHPSARGNWIPPGRGAAIEQQHGDEDEDMDRGESRDTSSAQGSMREQADGAGHSGAESGE